MYFGTSENKMCFIAWRDGIIIIQVILKFIKHSGHYLFDILHIVKDILSIGQIITRSHISVHIILSYQVICWVGCLLQRWVFCPYLAAWLDTAACMQQTWPFVPEFSQSLCDVS